MCKYTYNIYVYLLSLNYIYSLKSPSSCYLEQIMWSILELTLNYQEQFKFQNNEKLTEGKLK